jgi:hypothetical protein
MQGYLLSRPMPASDISKFLTSHSAGTQASKYVLRARPQYGGRVSAALVNFVSLNQNASFLFMGSSGLPMHYDPRNYRAPCPHAKRSFAATSGELP